MPLKCSSCLDNEATNRICQLQSLRHSKRLKALQGSEASTRTRCSPCKQTSFSLVWIHVDLAAGTACHVAASPMCETCKRDAQCMTCNGNSQQSSPCWLLIAYTHVQILHQLSTGQGAPTAAPVARCCGVRPRLSLLLHAPGPAPISAATTAAWPWAAAL